MISERVQLSSKLGFTYAMAQVVDADFGMTSKTHSADSYSPQGSHWREVVVEAAVGISECQMIREGFRRGVARGTATVVGLRRRCYGQPSVLLVGFKLASAVLDSKSRGRVWTAEQRTLTNTALQHDLGPRLRVALLFKNLLKVVVDQGLGAVPYGGSHLLQI